MNIEVLNKTVTVENDLIVITEETKTKKDRRTLDNDLVSIQRQLSGCVEQNKRVLEEFTRLKADEQVILGMIAQLPTSELTVLK